MLLYFSNMSSYSGISLEDSFVSGQYHSDLKLDNEEYFKDFIPDLYEDQSGKLDLCGHLPFCDQLSVDNCFDQKVHECVSNCSYTNEIVFLIFFIGLGVVVVVANFFILMVGIIHYRKQKLLKTDACKFSLAVADTLTGKNTDRPTACVNFKHNNVIDRYKELLARPNQSLEDVISKVRVRFCDFP